MSKSIKVSLKTWKELMNLKIKYAKRSMDEVIQLLLEGKGKDEVKNDHGLKPARNPCG